MPNTNWPSSFLAFLRTYLAVYLVGHHPVVSTHLWVRELGRDQLLLMVRHQSIIFEEFFNIVYEGH